MRTLMIAAAICTMSLGVAQAARAQGRSKSTSVSARAVTSAGSGTAQNQEFSLAEGEKRFRQNCGRCHVAPDKYPPRVMATVLRHMRVRATITDRDAKLILWYMTQ